MKVYLTEYRAYGDVWIGPVFAEEAQAMKFCEGRFEYDYYGEADVLVEESGYNE